MSDVSAEIGQALPPSGGVDLNSAAVRRLSGITTSGSTHSMDNLRGKGALISIMGNYNIISNNVGTQVTVRVQFFSDGTWQMTGTGATPTGTPTSGTWFALGSTAGIGNYYWIRFTATELISYGTGSYTASTGWLSLSSTQTISATASGANSERDVSYTVEIASDFGGTYIRSTNYTELDAVKAV